MNATKKQILSFVLAAAILLTTVIASPAVAEAAAKKSDFTKSYGTYAINFVTKYSNYEIAGFYAYALKNGLSLDEARQAASAAGARRVTCPSQRA